MADWTASFKLPKFSDEKFEKAHDAYVKKNGYTINVPAFDDIIHYKAFKPLTDQETKLWTGKIPVSEMPLVERSGEEIAALLLAGKGRVSAKRTMNAEEQKEYRRNAKNMIPPERRADIAAEKKKKKDRFMAMLASPSPKILRSAGSIAVAIDNAQDAISTLAVIGMITAAVAGGTTAALLAGPVGMIAGTAALLNLINPMKYMKWPRGRTKTGRAAKKDLEKFSDKNPFSKKARAKFTENLKKFRPKTGNAVEALQVTDNLFGIGISLGPIIGLIQDILSGSARYISGAKVKIKEPPNPFPAHIQKAMGCVKSTAAWHGFKWQSDMSLEATSLISANLALQAITPYMQDWNPFDQVEDLEHVQIEAPRPTDPLTIEIIAESGHSIDEVCNWSQNGERWISIGEIMDSTAQQATDNLRHFAEQNRNSVEAFIAVQNAHDFALGMIEAIEGPGSVETVYSRAERIVITILDQGWVYPDNITEAQIEKFEDWVYVHELMNTQPNYKDIWRYAEIFCGFKWAKSPDELR